MKPEQTISFEFIVSSIVKADNELSLQATRAVNVSLTLRNWLIGFYIAEFELSGENRAAYGEKLLSALSERLELLKMSNVARQQLYRYFRFYQTYPQILGFVAERVRHLLPAKLNLQAQIVGTVSPQLDSSLNMLIQHLSYSHFERLIVADTDKQRIFYEQQCLRGHWSVRELKRQMSSFLYERTDHVNQPQTTFDLTATIQKLEIRDPYIFEFLGIKASESATETAVEHGLLEKIQDFILELGHGFCFEARQKRILIGHEHFFVDLVFYHRILKCHVLIELKLGDFTHEHIGQLNTYVTWYKRHMMTDGDNPPVGILLCNQKNQALVEYALAGLDNDLFVSKYLLELPSKEVIQRFLDQTLKEQS
jgi:predicted nuclease of restriction endonuclease-like (RecB) superfamily